MYWLNIYDIIYNLKSCAFDAHLHFSLKAKVAIASPVTVAT